MKLFLLMLAVTGLGAGGTIAAAPTRPANYPRSYDALIDEALRERGFTVYSNIDGSEAAPVLAGFRARFPGVRLSYVDLNASDLYHRFVAESDAHRPSADLVISSAMDLQIKLINDGYAQAYASPEKPALPADAVWKNQGYGITAEPIVFIYNRRLIRDAQAPQTHADVATFLRRQKVRLSGKVATFDPAASGVGYLYLQQDLALTRDTWGLLEALSATKPVLLPHSQDMIDGVARGRFAFAYNAIGSYALQRARRDPALGVIFPRDYTLTMSRIGLIPAQAAHPAGARLFLDYLLSKQGQAQLGGRSLLPIRSDVPVSVSRPNARRAVPIRVGPQLLANLDRIKRQRFLKRWADIRKQK